MLKDAISATYKDGYKIEVTFEDGAAGIDDFEKYLEKGGVFNKFKDIDFFKKFSINEELGVLVWGDEIDIAPETLHTDATQSPLPDWVDFDQNSLANRPHQLTA